MDGDDRLFFVTPARNQAGHLRPLFCAVARQMQGLGCEWEIVFVDDGSDDDTPAALRALAAEDPRVRAVRLSRPFGVEAAVLAGLAHFDGAAAVVVDAALEHPADTIPAMLAAWREGAKVVRPACRGCKSNLAREFEPCVFGLLDREVVAALATVPLGDRPLNDTLDWLGYRATAPECPPVHRRAADMTTKPAGRDRDAAHPRRRAPWSSMLAGLTAFGVAAAFAGLIVWLAALCAAGVFGPEIIAAAATSAAMVLFSGAQLTGVGLAVRHLRRSCDEMPGQPRYVAVESIGFDRPRTSPEPEPAILRFSTASRRRNPRPVLRDKVST